MIEANEQGFVIGMAAHINPENIAGNTTVKTFYHSIGLGRIGLRRTTDDFEFRACFFEGIGGETCPTICEHMGDMERKGFLCLAQVPFVHERRELRFYRCRSKRRVYQR